MGIRNSCLGKCSWQHPTIIFLKTFPNCAICRVYMYLPSAPWDESELSSQEREGTMCISDSLCLNKLCFSPEKQGRFLFFSLVWACCFWEQCQYLYMIFCLLSWYNSWEDSDLFHNVELPRQFFMQSQVTPC